MTTSGTVGATVYPVNKVIEQAYRRCGFPTTTLESEVLEVGRDNLFLMLSAWANRGLNLWRIQSQTAITLVAGTPTYTLPVGTVDLLNVVYRNTQNIDTVMASMSRDEYAFFPNKLTQGRPVLYWYDRQPTPQITFWPVPDTNNAQGTAVVWLHMQIQDVGEFTNTLNVPQRWLEAVVSGLALRLLPELPKANLARLPMLQMAADAALHDVETEETDSSPIYLTPDISYYSM